MLWETHTLRNHTDVNSNPGCASTHGQTSRLHFIVVQPDMIVPTMATGERVRLKHT